MSYLFSRRCRDTYSRLDVHKEASSLSLSLPHFYFPCIFKQATRAFGRESESSLSHKAFQKLRVAVFESYEEDFDFPPKSCNTYREHEKTS